jgi:hypothetical protein
MFDPTAALACLGLLLSLLLRLFQPSAIFIRTLTRTERELAVAIRATLAACGEAAPEMDDAALVAWFVANRPEADKPARPGSGAAQRPKPNRAEFAAEPVAALQRAFSPALDRRRPAGLGPAGWEPAVRGARAPP